MMKRILWKVGLFILAIVVIGVLITVHNSYTYNKYFKEVAIAKCVTKGMSFNESSTNVRYLYKVNKYVYEGSYSLHSNDRVKAEKGIYYCIYSKKDAKVNAFIPTSNIAEVKEIKEDSILLKKYLDRSQKALYLSGNNKQ